MQYQVFHLLKLYQQVYPGREDAVSAQELKDFGRKMLKTASYEKEVNPYDASDFYDCSDLGLRSILHS